MKQMGCLKTVVTCLICLSFSPGGIQSENPMKDDCSNSFLTSLLEAGYEIDTTVDLTLNLQYEDEEGVKKTAAIKVRDECKEPKILCDGETDVIKEEFVTGPLFSCSWKWNEKDESTENYVIARLNDEKEIEISGSISQDNENIFPNSSDKGLLDFKLIAKKWNGEENKYVYPVKRKHSVRDNSKKRSKNPGTGVSPRANPVSTEVPSTAQSISRVNNKLTYLLWTMWGSLLMFTLT